MAKIGKYEIVERLGGGSFGSVYLALDAALSENVAIKLFDVKDTAQIQKILDTHQGLESTIRKRFVDEAKILRSLANNPHIVDMYEFDYTKDNIPYYVMPYFKRNLIHEIGKDVTTKTSVKDLSADETPKAIAFSTAIDFIRQLLIALKQVHKSGLIHRDIKPANILLDKNHQLQLSDFGIAKLPLSEHSMTSIAMGSKHYISPEQQDGSTYVTQSSDIYSLSVLAYRMLTGSLPIGRFENPSILTPQIGPALDQLIIRGLSIEPDNRPQNAEEFSIQFERALTLEISSPNEISPAESALVNKINEKLKAQGEISKSDHHMLQPLAHAAQLSDSKFNEFVTEQILKQCETDPSLKGFVDWVTSVNAYLSKLKSNIDAEQKRALIESGVLTTQQSKALLTEIVTQKLADRDRALEREKQLSNKSKQRELVNKFKPYIAGVALFLCCFWLLQNYVSYNQKKQTDAINEQYAWEIALAENTLTAYRQFMSNWPQGLYYQQALKKEATAKKRMLEQKSNKDKEQVETLTLAQSWLNKLGYEVIENGVFDARTKNAVNSVEEAHGLMKVGVVDLLFVEKLKDIFNERDQTLWRDALNGNSQASYQHYIDINPHGEFYLLAQTKLTTFKKQQRKLNIAEKEHQYQQRKRANNEVATGILNSLVSLPGGKFTLGCQQLPCSSRTLPTRAIVVKRFSMMAQEVTFAMWDTCVDSGFCAHKPADNQWGRDQRPVINISYLDIRSQFIPWVNYISGREFSLPTEIQWEYAAKANKALKYSWGNTITCSQARWGQFSGSCGNERKTSVVGQYAANSSGLFDLHGNVWEWTTSCWQNNYQSLSQSKDNQQSKDCSVRSLRGGAWDSHADLVRSIVRRGEQQENRRNNVGFRLVTSN